MRISSHFLFGGLMTAAVVVISSVAGDGPALAQKPPLENFKRADDVKGCAGIPYPELARLCTDATVDLHESCKLVKWSCREGNLQSVRTNKEMARDIGIGIESQENTLRTEERNLASAKDADKRVIEDRIRDLKKAIGEQQDKKKAAQERELGARKETELRLVFGTKCLELRGRVMGFYKEGIDRAKSDAARSGGAADDVEIKRLIQKNMSRWESEYEDHKKAMNDVTDGIKFCQDWLQGR